jgi:hypothetical protein
MTRHLASITGAQDSRSRSHERREASSDTLREQQRLDPVLDAQPLLHQMLALAVRALSIFLVRRGYAHHAAVLAITPEVSRKHTQHALRIEPVCLGATRAAVDEDAGRLEHVAGNAVCGQQPVQPETVTSRLKAAGHCDFTREFGRKPRTQRRHQRKQSCGVAAIDPMQA